MLRNYNEPAFCLIAFCGFERASSWRRAVSGSVFCFVRWSDGLLYRAKACGGQGVLGGSRCQSGAGAALVIENKYAEAYQFFRRRLGRIDRRDF